MTFLNIFSSNKKIKFLIFLVLPLLIIFFIYKSYSLNIYKFFDKSLISLGFILKETKVEGLVSLTKKDIIDKIVYNNCSNLFCVNLKETKSSIKELDWIKKVKISLVLPTSLKISIEEQKPKYIFVEKNIFKLLNSDGKLITKVDRVKEKYKIINSDFSFDEVGQVEIGVELSMMGLISFDTSDISKGPGVSQKLNEINRLFDTVRRLRRAMRPQGESGSSNATGETWLNSVTSMSGIGGLDNETRTAMNTWRTSRAS